ncbi:LTA synthase family protein (plasmid) [Serratia nevei]|uniref:LTA synthase family protein n=1 Tax=Serratia nevei TaxID=2703794 RepID=UPI003F6BB6E9
MRAREVHSAWRFKYAPKIWGYSLLLFIAAIIILAGNRSAYSYSLIVAINAFIFFFSLLYLLSGRGIFSLAFSSALVINLQFLNQLKVHFYKDTLLFSDFSMMFDLANIGTLLHYPSAGLAFMGISLFAIFTGIMTWCAIPRRQGYLPVIGGLGVMIATGLAQVQAFARFEQEWSGTLPGGTGVVSNLVMSSRQARFISPTFPTYSSDDFKKRSEQQGIHTTSHVAGNPPDIVLLLQESTADPRLYRLPDPTLLPHFSMFESGGNVKAHTPLRVQTFGGGTWLSEFAVLTGLRSDDFGPLKSAVFYTVIDHVHDSLFKQLKRNGYYTVVLTPFNKSAYNAGHAYSMMGVDKIIQPQELGYPGSLQDNLWHISTVDMLKYVREVMSKETDKPLFIYALTMYEHGPYDADHLDDFHLTSSLGNVSSVGKFSHYIEKIKASDSALSSFSQFVDHRAKPTLFMYFGDHQPNIDWVNGYTTPLPDATHLTQFSLRDNDNQGAVSDLGDVTDIAFLGGILLERARLTVSPFWQANIAMRHLCQGRMSDCEDKDLLNSYRHYIFDELNVASDM